MNRAEFLDIRLQHHMAFAHSVDIGQGATTLAQRRERARRAILAAKLGPVICGKGQDGKPKTYAQIFAEAYGEQLEVAA